MCVACSDDEHIASCGLWWFIGVGVVCGCCSSGFFFDFLLCYHIHSFCSSSSMRLMSVSEMRYFAWSCLAAVSMACAVISSSYAGSPVNVTYHACG